MTEPEEAAFAALPERLPGLDALRAIAAGAVCLSHVAAVSMLGAATPRLDEDGAEALGILTHAAGSWGVGIFFILSGLCIHLPLARKLAIDKNARLSLRPYYARRFTRIYPPHLIALLLSIGVAALLPVLPVDAQLLSVPTVPQFVAHLFLVHSFGWDAISSGNAVLWTIAVEFHFYLLYPLILRWRRRWPMAWIVAALFAFSVALIAASQQWLPDDVWLIGDTFAARIWEWAMGCWLAEQLVARGVGKGVPRVAVLAAMLASIGIGYLSLNDPRAVVALPWVWPLFAALIVALGARMRMSPASRIDRAFAAIGRGSYSLYLTHPIAIVGIAGLLFTSQLSPAPQAILELLGVGLLCALFFRFVERPFLISASRYRSSNT